MDAPTTSLRLDPRALRVLAHPLRSRLLTALRMRGPATATSLAHELATNTGATSYHLRKLASVGLVEETEDGRGRERWWRASTASHEWRDRDLAGDPNAEAASDWLKRHYFDAFVARYERWLDAAAEESVDWRDAADSGDAEIRVSADRLRAFEAELLALIDRYRASSPDEQGARRVAVYFHMFPVTPAETDRVDG